jgi:Fe-S-cluster containining protein
MPESTPTRTWFACQRCAACCKWPGEVVLLESEVVPIAAHLGLDPDDFVARFTRLRANRQGLTLIEKPNGECILLEGNHCRINPVKPHQCRGFPNKWNFPGWRNHCEAIPLEIPITDPRFQD